MSKAVVHIGRHKIRRRDIAFMSLGRVGMNGEISFIEINVRGVYDPLVIKSTFDGFKSAMELFETFGEGEDIDEPPGEFTLCGCGRVAEPIARGADAAEFPGFGDIVDDGVDSYPTAPGPSTPKPGFPPTPSAEATKADAISRGVMP